MPTSVHEVFDAFRQAPSNYERGAKFEKLMTQPPRPDQRLCIDTQNRVRR